MKNSRLVRFLSSLAGSPQVIVLTHDNPDPDAVAAGWGMKCLIERTMKVPVDFVAGGIISRAENRMLVELLEPPLTMSNDPLPVDGRAIVVVDTLLPARLLDHGSLPRIAAVIDHHVPPVLPSRRRPRFRYRDVRPKVVACSSMVVGYLREAGVPLPRKLATALLYGIYTDAKGHAARFTRLDRSAMTWLTPQSDPDLYARIERATLRRDYFEDLLLALECCFTYDSVGLCLIPAASGPEIVGEVADLLIRCESIDRLLCGARIGERMVFSARSTEEGGNVSLLIEKALKPLGGFCGGHGHRAGGYVPLSALPSKAEEDVEALVRGAWLEACAIDKSRGVRLVAKREILKALS